MRGVEQEVKGEGQDVRGEGQDVRGGGAGCEKGGDRMSQSTKKESIAHFNSSRMATTMSFT